MKIERVSAQNFKNLKLEDVPFRGVTLVLGENGMGKSNLLVLLHTLFIKKEAPKELAAAQNFPIDGFIEDDNLLRRGSNTGAATVRLACFNRAYTKMHEEFFGKVPVTHEATVEFELARYSNGVNVTVKRIKVGKNDVFPIPGKEEDKGRAAKRKVLEDWVSEDLVNATTYVPNARVLKRGLAAFNLGGTASAVDDLENTLLRLLTDKDLDPETLDKVKETMKDFFSIEDVRPDVRARTPPPAKDGTQPPQQLGVGVRLKEANGKWFELGQVGTGIQQILVIVTMIQQNPARIALIEEFESSLSIRKRNHLLQRLIEFVGPGKPLRQVITTSHAIFQPAAAEVHSIGTDHPSKRDDVNFRPWTNEDWKLHGAAAKAVKVTPAMRVAAQQRRAGNGPD